MQPLQRDCISRRAWFRDSLPVGLDYSNRTSDPRVRRKSHIMYNWQWVDPWVDSLAVLCFLLCSRSCFFVPLMRLKAGAVFALAEEVRPFATVAHAMMVPNEPRRSLQKPSHKRAGERWNTQKFQFLT